MSISDMDDVINILRSVLQIHYEPEQIDSMLRGNGYCPICYRSIESNPCSCDEWNRSDSESSDESKSDTDNDKD